MYAVIKTGGKQYRVTEGDIIIVEKLEGDVGNAVEFNEVLMTGDDENYNIGTPLVDGAKVTGAIVAQEKNKKIIVFKSKRRKGYMKKQGHRQNVTRLKIEKIES
jgi:large subunit ribosomal protein L21